MLAAWPPELDMQLFMALHLWHRRTIHRILFRSFASLRDLAGSRVGAILFAAILSLGLGFVAGCGGGTKLVSSATSQGSGAVTGTGTGNNTLSIAVNGGPEAGQPNGFVYYNAAFATATICAPGSSSNCVTIDNLLVDTGSNGLRVFDYAVSSLNLPAVNAANGSAAYDCVSFVDGTYLWGTVEHADVTLGGESASGVPIQVIDSSPNNVPSDCSNGGTDDNSVAVLGANGILGVGTEPTDCYGGGSPCDPSSGLSSPPPAAYYTCSGGTCSPAFVATANQVANPVALFATDNNGVIVELPSAPSSAGSMDGSLVFGIGTESNNQLASATTIFTLACDNFTTVLDGQSFGITNAATCAGPGSFIDSGSNALYFPNVPNIQECSQQIDNGGLSGLYCPNATQSFSATNEGEDGASKATPFSVANAQSLLPGSSTASDAVQPGMAGTNAAGFGFDWGLPFFYGVNVYNAIEGQKVPSGAPPGPWWAY